MIMQFLDELLHCGAFQSIINGADFTCLRIALLRGFYLSNVTLDAFAG